MKRFPYHHCQAPGCCEMIAPAALFCARHVLAQVEHDMFLPEVESLSVPIAGPELSTTTAASSDAAIGEKHE